jgi:hypothetical protein
MVLTNRKLLILGVILIFDGIVSLIDGLQSHFTVLHIAIWLYQILAEP